MVYAVTREALVIDVDRAVKGEQAVAMTIQMSWIGRTPKTIRVDSGPEFIPAVDR